MMMPSMNIVISIGARDAQRDAYPVQIQHEGKPLADDWVHIDRQALLEKEHKFSAHDYGMELCDALLTKKLDRTYQRLVGQAGVASFIQVQLVIHPDAPELQALPWERLFHVFGDGEVPISTDARTPFSRFLVSGAGDRPPVPERPLRIFVAVANPTNLPNGCTSLDVEGEVRSLVDLLANYAGRVQGTLLAGQSQLSAELQTKLAQQGWTVVEGVTNWQTIQRHLPGHHILHILAHGQFKAGAATGTGTTYLLLEHEGSAGIARGSLQRVADDIIATGLIGVHPRPHLIFLAACNSARRPDVGTASTGANPFVGLAPKLVAAYVPAVVAMQDEVPIDLAHTLTTDFYRRLFEHGRVDLALNEARSLVYESGKFEWAIPVLFLSLQKGRLFAAPGHDLAVPERVIFDGLIEEHTRLFAGREAAIAETERFMADPTGGYLLIKAGAGLGKTALMANLVTRHPEDLAYHFFSPRVPESLQEPVFVRNLLEQISPWYGVTDAPSGQPEEMRKRFDKFLGETPPGNRTIMLDGLDEVSGWDLSRYLARRVQPGLHFVLTVREEGRDPVVDYALPIEQVQSMQLVGLTRDGVQALLRAAGGDAVHFAEDDKLLDQVCRVTAYDAEKPELGADTLFVRFLVEDAAAGHLKSTALTRMPSRMESYLDRWWKAIKAQFGEEGERKKRQQALVDLAMTMAAALGPIGTRDLEKMNPSLISDTEQDFVETVIEAVQRIIVRDPRGDVTLFHPRLRDYLRQKLRTERYKQRLLKYCAKWQQHRSRYALIYYARHLVDAVVAVDQSERLPWIESLVELVTNKQFQDAYLAETGDLRGLQADLQRTLETVAEDTAPETLPLLVSSALSSVRFRRERLRPEYIFDLAVQGNIAGAKRMIELFEMDTKWRQTVLLETAWLGSLVDSKHGREQARALRAEVTAAIRDLPPDDQRQILLRWIEAGLEGKPWPQGNLPPASTPMELRAKLDAAGGVSPEADVSPEMLMSIEGINWNVIARGIVASLDQIDEMSEEMFISYYIGPGLVALAVEEPQTGESFLRQYLNVHSAYTYTNYRFGSSWALLRPILQHPDPDWVREHVRALLIAALGGGSLEFEEGLPLTVLALRAGSCVETARELPEYAARIHEEALALNPNRGEGDTWGRYKRLLATLAQAQTVIGVDVGAPSHRLLNDALGTHYGYAGYQAPACLTLAEAIRICQPAEENAWITWALESAQQAAHNIQEGAFCARTTARINAMRQQWWPGSDLDVRAEIAALRADPRLARFAALHYIGHAYQGRGAPPQSFPLPNRVREADTLAMLASAYQRDLPEFLRLNRDWDPEQVIPSGTHIHVPDPGMAPLLAARLAAEVLTVAGLTQKERVALIRSLVPLAVANPTALDTVLARLLLAEQPTAPAMLTQLEALAPMPVDEQTSGSPGELTVIMP